MGSPVLLAWFPEFSEHLPKFSELATLLKSQGSGSTGLLRYLYLRGIRAASDGPYARPASCFNAKSSVFLANRSVSYVAMSIGCCFKIISPVSLSYR